MAGKDKPKAVVVGNADHMQRAAHMLERAEVDGPIEIEDDNTLALPEVNNLNEFGLGVQMNVIRPIRFPEFTTRQQAYRFAAWLITMAEVSLPQEPGEHELDDILRAVQNS